MKTIENYKALVPFKSLLVDIWKLLEKYIRYSMHIEGRDHFSTAVAVCVYWAAFQVHRCILIILLMVQKSGAHQLRLVVDPIICRVLYIPGGCLGFLPSAVC